MAQTSEQSFEALAKRMDALEQNFAKAYDAANAHRAAITEDVHQLQRQVSMGEQAHSFIKEQVVSIALDVKTLINSQHEDRGAQNVTGPLIDQALKVLGGIAIAVAVYKFGLH